MLHRRIQSSWKPSIISNETKQIGNVESTIFSSRERFMSSKAFLDSIVIGKGLVGSAAGKYLSMFGERVAVIGPDEPSDLSKAIVFASHYDSGRVQRLIGTDRLSTLVNLQAARQYPRLELASGIRFHIGVGCLYVNPRGNDDYLKDAANKALQYGLKAQLFESAQELAKAFPAFRFPETSQGLFEPAPAGHINPRNLIAAQLVVAAQNGCEIVRETVRDVRYLSDHVAITTHESSTIRARKVLFATGAFSNLLNSPDRRLALVLKSETIILLKLSASEAERMVQLPSLLYEINVPELEGIYLTGPVRYPDGSLCIKMGCNLPQDIFFGDSLEEIQAWFRNGDSESHVPLMLDAAKTLLPDLVIEDCISKRCILTRTRNHGNPYIGRVGEQSFAAIGTGYSAMCSDSLGRLAAGLMVNGTFPEEYDPHELEIVCT